MTLWLKSSRRQRGRMYSRKTRLPGAGARGRMRLAGTSRRAFQQAAAALAPVQSTAARMQRRETSGYEWSSMSGTAYMIW